MPETTENYDLIRTAQESVGAQELEHGIYFNHRDGQLIDLRDQLWLGEARLPARKTGAYVVTDIPSFVASVAKHGLAQTEVWAVDSASQIRAVINAHEADQNAGHQDHTLTLQLQRTDDWKDWTSKDGQFMDQATFAEFIEDHLPNMVSPTSADMLELAQTFQATTKVDFASSQRIKSGETQLTYAENQTASAGKKGNLTIPDTFEIALQPFDRGDTYKVSARFRYRINGTHLLLGYRLTRPKDVLRDAFDQVVAKVAADTGRDIWSTT
jgi:uncharacterized protein YfdQ (DUF2303 family)